MTIFEAMFRLAKWAIIQRWTHTTHHKAEDLPRYDCYGDVVVSVVRRQGQGKHVLRCIFDAAIQYPWSDAVFCEHLTPERFSLVKWHPSAADLAAGRLSEAGE